MLFWVACVHCPSQWSDWLMQWRCLALWTYRKLMWSQKLRCGWLVHAAASQLFQQLLFACPKKNGTSGKYWNTYFTHNQTSTHIQHYDFGMFFRFDPSKQWSWVYGSAVHWMSLEDRARRKHQLSRKISLYLCWRLADQVRSRGRAVLNQIFLWSSYIWSRSIELVIHVSNNLFAGHPGENQPCPQQSLSKQGPARGPFNKYSCHLGHTFPLPTRSPVRLGQGQKHSWFVEWPHMLATCTSGIQRIAG